MKKIFICSPFSNSDSNIMSKNIQFAKDMCLLAFSEGYAPIAPHLLYPTFLDDNSKLERKLGLNAGFEFLKTCDEIWICLPEWQSEFSSGMKLEIKLATFLSKPITHKTNCKY